jgi:hypothetical protein
VRSRLPVERPFASCANGCSQSFRRFGCNADLLASIMVGFLSSYSGYRGANGISDRNAKNECKNEIDRFHSLPPRTEPIFYRKWLANQALSNQIYTDYGKVA